MRQPFFATSVPKVFVVVAFLPVEALLVIVSRLHCSDASFIRCLTLLAFLVTFDILSDLLDKQFSRLLGCPGHVRCDD